MADTTTPNLGLTKIQIGASRDSWGTKINANMDLLDTAVDAAKDTADAALPKAGGTVTGAITRSGAGAVPYFAAASLTSGRIYIVPAAGTDPTSQPGDQWLGY